MAGDKWEGRQLFDDKLMVQADYMYDGVKGGVAWKGKLSRYFITKVPALGDVLKWSEKHGKGEVTEDAFDTVIGHFMERPKQDAVNAAIWGFLAGCLSGPADTHFKKADDCNGLGAPGAESCESSTAACPTSWKRSGILCGTSTASLSKMPRATWKAWLNSSRL